jgi:hypothetical protein
MTVHFIEPTFYSDDARKMWPRREQKAAETMTIEKVEDWRDMLRTGKAVIEMDDLSFSTKQELTSWLRGRPAYLTLEPHLSGLMPDGAIDEQLAWISENLDRLAVGAVRF